MVRRTGPFTSGYLVFRATPMYETQRYWQCVNLHRFGPFLQVSTYMTFVFRRQLLNG